LKFELIGEYEDENHTQQLDKAIGKGTRKERGESIKNPLGLKPRGFQSVEKLTFFETQM
jgi:hypothetical protein